MAENEKKRVNEVYSNSVQIRHFRLKELRELGQMTKRILKYIESFRDLSDKQKAELYDDTCLQTRSSLPKENPWRK